MSLSAEIFGSDSWIFKLGNTLGLGIPGWADRTFGTNPDGLVNKLGDISKQMAEEGMPRTIVWGRVRPIGGTIMYAQAPQKRWTVSYEDASGKGGAGDVQEIWTERVFRTYAIGICEGPISKIIRVWNNNRLVYDARGNAWGERNNPTFLANKRIYLGTFDQMPCPELQAIWGNDIPAHRGTAYMVWIDRDLTNFGGAIPQYQFEVERAEGTYLTSRPYSLEVTEGIEQDPSSAFSTFVVAPENMQQSPMEILSGQLRGPLAEYTDGEPEAIENDPLEILEGQLRGPLVEYTMETEAMDSSPPQVTEGEIRVALIDYAEWPVEALDQATPEITGGSLA